MSDQTSLKTSQRLHITPLRPELLSAYLGPTLTPLAKNISYHTVQNFPEVGFGYLELPMAEAAKLKKKLNGSILKGQKIRIEDAQPEKRKRTPDEDDGADEDAEKPHKKTRRSKKQKPGDKVLQGIELEDGRKVKRGWTETSAEKRTEKEKKKKSKDKSDKEAKKEKKHKREASKYTNEPECLFRTGLPATDADASDKAAEKKRKKDKRKEKAEVVVHEFSNTKKHASFLKSAAVSGEHATREYVDGKGWVDADGNVLEAETMQQKDKRERKERKQQKKAEKAAIAELEAEKSKAAVEVASTAIAEKRKSKPRKEPTPEASEASSEEASSPEPSSDEESSASDSEEDQVNGAAETKEVHPLEALYKRPVLSPLDTTPNTSKANAFSFFGGEDDSDIEQDEHTNPNTEPQTPFNEEDMEWRGVRSAAPTPDTAAIGKRFSFSVMDDISEDEGDEEATERRVTAAANKLNNAVNGLGIIEDANSVPIKPRQLIDGEEKEESEFAKWFFENRSDNNKKWRARRREAMKMKRKRENRRLTRRIV